MQGGIDPGDRHFIPGLLEFSMYGKFSDPWMGHYPHRAALAL